MVLDTYAVHGGNLISIELHTLTHRERHEGEKGGQGMQSERRREGKRHVSTCKEKGCG